MDYTPLPFYILISKLRFILQLGSEPAETIMEGKEATSHSIKVLYDIYTFKI